MALLMSSGCSVDAD